MFQHRYSFLNSHTLYILFLLGLSLLYTTKVGYDLMILTSIIITFILIFDTLHYVVDPQGTRIRILRDQFPNIYYFLEHNKRTNPDTSFVRELIADLKIFYNPDKVFFWRYFWIIFRFILLTLFTSFTSYGLVKSNNIACNFEGITKDNNLFDHIYYNITALTTINYDVLRPSLECTTARLFSILEIFYWLTFLIIGAAFFFNYLKTNLSDLKITMENYIKF
ncbi:MAG: hypothetical protein GF353_11235 [Candidatus Lokiarchaeota archaeon]|nr:hypothetical protein [Candidatus Lokiarchaeota archaeon]